MAHSGVGGIAQLVERLLCKQDVSGSSPLTSTDDFLMTNSKEILLVEMDLDLSFT